MTAPQHAQIADTQPTAKPITPWVWVSLGLLAAALVLVIVGDTSAVISADTPLVLSGLAALCAIGAAMGALALQAERTWIWVMAVIIVAGFVFAWAAYDYASARQTMDQARQCLADLASC